jgi:hypothetical protein
MIKSTPASNCANFERSGRTDSEGTQLQKKTEKVLVAEKFSAMNSECLNPENNLNNLCEERNSSKADNASYTWQKKVVVPLLQPMQKSSPLQAEEEKEEDKKKKTHKKTKEEVQTQENKSLTQETEETVSEKQEKQENYKEIVLPQINNSADINSPLKAEAEPPLQAAAAWKQNEGMNS